MQGLESKKSIEILKSMLIFNGLKVNLKNRLGIMLIIKPILGHPVSAYPLGFMSINPPFLKYILSAIFTKFVRALSNLYHS